MHVPRRLSAHGPRIALGASLALLAGGCVTAPTSAPTFETVAEETLGLGSAARAPVDPQWWKGFGDRQLDALIDEALAHNPTLDEALSRVRAAQAQTQAVGAPLRPGLTLDGQEVRQRLSENYTAPPRSLGFPAGGGGTYWVGQLAVNLNWDLDFWGRQASLLKASQAQQRAADLDVAAARLALSGAIAQAYVDLYRAYALADVADAAIAQRQALLKLALSRVRAGLDNELDQRSAEALLPQAKLARLQADDARELAVHRLAALAGHGADYYAQIQRPQIQLDTALPLPDALPIDLLAHRPDVLAARARVDATRAGREAARAAFYPDISLNAFAGFQSVGLDQLFDAGSRVYGAGPTLHLPIFDSQRLKAQYHGATADLDAAVAAYNDDVLGAVRDVSDQLSRRDSLLLQREQAQQTLQAARKALALASSRYRAGLATQRAALDAESQVLSSERDLISVESALVIARVSLLLTLGGSFEPPADAVADDAAPSPSSLSSAAAVAGADS